MSSAICFNLDQSKILSSGNGLRSFYSKNYSITRKISTLLVTYIWRQPLHLSMLSLSSFTNTLQNILSKPLPAFPHNHSGNIGRMNPVAMIIINSYKEHWVRRDQTNVFLFSSPVRDQQDLATKKIENNSIPSMPPPPQFPLF